MRKTSIFVIIVCAAALVGVAAGVRNMVNKTSASGGVPTATDELTSDNEQTAEGWADSVLATLTPRQRVAQLFVPRWDFEKGVINPSVMRNQVVNEGVGGFLLGKGTAEEYVEAINKAQSMARVPLLVTLDGEWGLNMRVPDAPRFPKNIALGAIQDPRLIEEYGREVAMECRLTGIQVDFAPVLDVNSNPKNPVIGFRSFGEDPQRVAELGAAYCRGMESGGVMSVGKHFPGHGDTSVDSHKALPTVDHSLPTLEAVDFVPFIKAMEAGMSGIMIGHLRVPALDKSGTPASLSKIITTDVLQGKLGFSGLIFTDALAMKGAATSGENNCVSAFRAGADILLSSASPVKDIQAMMDAIKAGKISQKEVDLRCRKLLEYKYRLGLACRPKVKKEGIVKRLNSMEAKALMDRLSKASVTVLANKKDFLPIKDANAATCIISLGAKADNDFSVMCRKYAANSTCFGVSTPQQLAPALAKAKTCSTVIVGVYVANADAISAYAQVLKACPQTVSVFFINPFKMDGFKGVGQSPSLVTAYDDTRELQQAAAQALYGGIDVTGRFPVNISGVAKAGSGIDLKKKE